MAGGHSHRSTLKNDHKPFKSKHATKGQLKNQYKGKVEKSSASANNKSNKPLSKLERKNIAKQLKNSKILETKTTRKVFEGSQGAEKIVTIIGLTDDVSTSEIASMLVNCIKDSENDDDMLFEVPSVTPVKIQRFKSNMKFILPDQTNFLSILDAAKVSDYVVFGISAEKEVEKEYGEQILRAVIAQGIASVIGVLPNVCSAYPKRNLQMDIRQSLQSFFNHFFPNEEKLFALENDSECTNCIRTMAQKFPKSITWRDNRGYLLADAAYWAPAQDNNGSGNLVVEGTVRGTGFNANRLVHIPGFGDFQIDHIEKLHNVRRSETDEETTKYFPEIENQEGLEELNEDEVDMDAEDWDLEGEDEFGGVKMTDKRYFDDDGSRNLHHSKPLPKGTSEYQGRWYLDDVLEDASDIEDDADVVGQAQDDEMELEDGAAATTDYEPTEAGDNQSEMFVELSPEEEARQLQEYRSSADEDLEFPDELELDPMESGKERLASYRGIKSLGNCNWDYDEHDPESPSIWKRLLRVNNYKATRNKIVKQSIREAQLTISNKARIFIRAPLHILERINCQQQPFTVYGLLEHEHKLAHVNFSFESWEDFEEPIASKETLVVQYGPRRQVINPVFNQASNNSNNVHKFEKFHHPGNFSIASCIAPVLFSNAPTIFFRPNSEDGSLELVGQGTFLNSDHTRVVAERAVLTGHPVKIHKRLVTVRYMFFNAEDINWFKAIPLFTKSGRSGFIKESLGTHGYFKATFDGKLTAQDTVAMSMYRRVWPEISSQWME